MKALIIGSCVLDVYIQLPHLPLMGEDVNSNDLNISLGGMAYNVYHVMKLLQTNPILGCPVGEGLRADIVTDLLEKQGDKPIGVIPDIDNGMCLCLVDDSRERSFVSHHGAEYRFDPQLFQKLCFDEVEWIYVSGLEIEDHDGGLIVEFLEEKKKSLFFAPGPRLNCIPADQMERLFKLHPILHINEREVMLLTRQKDLFRAAEELNQKTQNAVIITLGERGALLKQNACAPQLIPTERVAMVDSTGAGDNHAGAVLAGISQGMKIEDAIRRANLISGYTVQQKGAVLSQQNFDLALKNWKQQSEQHEIR